MTLGLVSLGLGTPGLVKRCVLRSGGQSRVMVASVADGIVADGIAGGGIVVGAGVSLVAKLVASKVAGIRGWIRCGSGLRRVVRGRVRRTMSLWI